jgi:hypothetical protein
MTLLSGVQQKTEAVLDDSSADCIVRMSEDEFVALVQQIVAAVKSGRTAPRQV